MCGSVVLLDCRPFSIALQSVWVALNDDDGFPLTMEKSSKKWRKGLAIYERRCIVCPVTGVPNPPLAKETMR